MPTARRGVSNTVVIVISVLVGGGVMLGVLAALLRPTLGPARQAAWRSASRDNLKQFGVAAFNYHDRYDSFPLVTYPDAPHHSWHTLSLPQLEQARLFEGIDRSKSWDDPINARAFQSTVTLFLNPGVSGNRTTDAGYAATHYELNTQLVPARGPMRFRDVTDGLTTTVLSGEVNSNFRAWGDPAGHRDLALGINADPSGFGSPFSGGAQFLFVDGSVHFIGDNAARDVLEALGDPNDGRAVDVP